MSHLHYDRRGDPITLARWCELIEVGGEDYKRIARDEIDDVVVSTVWLGLNHNWDPEGPPLIFESMVFGGVLDGEQARYSSEELARSGHADLVALVRVEAAS